MTDDKEINRWLSEYYPTLQLRRMPQGGFGIWQEDRRVHSYEWNGFEFGVVEIGRSIVFDIRNRLLGGWIKDEIQKRDPRLWQNPGNFYHDGYLLSKIAEDNHKKRKAATAASGLAQWEACKKNEKLMNRVFKRMESGDMSGAAKEFSLEEMCKNAYLERPGELRSKDFWRAVRSYK